LFDGVVKFEFSFWKGKERWRGEVGIKTIISEVPMMTFLFFFGSSKRSMYSIIGTPMLSVGHDFLSLLGNLMINVFFFGVDMTMYIHRFTLFFACSLFQAFEGHCNGCLISFLSNPITPSQLSQLLMKMH
jgi:hypothetical protein